MKRKNRNHWNKITCAKEALKYLTRKEYQNGSKGSYLSAFKNGWLDDICLHMIKPISVKKIWTIDTIKIEALKYTTRVSFSEKSRGAYKSAHRNGWLDIVCAHMNCNKKPNNYWNIDLIKVEANKYSSKREFRKWSGAAYSAASKLDCIDVVCAHMEKCGNLISRCVYVYEFSDNHAYIGLTCNYNRRKYQHLNCKKSPVYKHTIKTNILPTHNMLSNGYVDVYLAQQLEKYWCDCYKKNGWILLNSNRTGGTGGITLPKNINNKKN